MPADVVLYVTNYCPYCVLARRLLRGKGIAFREVDMTGDPDGRRRLADRAGAKTVPQAFVNGRCVGGFDALSALDRRGELDRRLAEPPPAGAEGTDPLP